jgi:hypothetical protein
MSVSLLHYHHISLGQVWCEVIVNSNSMLLGGPAQKMSIFQMALKWFLSDQTYST